MKRSPFLAVAVVALMLLATVPAQSAHAQGAYTEKLNVYVAGSNALWYFTFGGINGSSRLTALEGTPGLSWYNITAISTTGWKSDFQVFGSSGYDLLPVPFIPSQGLFLTIGSDSYSHAAAAASALDSYLLTSFTSLSNGTGKYTFYSPLSFTNIIPSTLFAFVPSAEGGFAGALPSGATYAASASPFIVLEGESAAGGFSHTLVVGSISTSALTSASQPNLLRYFGGSPKTLNASSSSASSVVKVTILDGEISSQDPAAVVNNGAKWTGTYTLNLVAGEALHSINASVYQGSAPLLATRAVDVGVLRTNSDLAVTLSLTNLSPTNTISSISFVDDWWNGSAGFSFLSGNDTLSNVILGAGERITPVYRLQYTGTSVGSLTIPASVIRYQYQVGTLSFNATAILNPITLSLNADEAVVYAVLTPLGTLGKPVGSDQQFNLTLVNVGTLPASSVVAAGKSIAGLAARSGSLPGGSATLKLSQSASGLTGINTTESYPVTWQDPSGTNLATRSNSVSNVFSHSSMDVGWPVLTLSSKIIPAAGGSNNLTLGFAVSDSAPRNVTSFVATGILPAGLGCGTISGIGVTCLGGKVTISYRVLNISSTVHGSMSYNLTGASNYIIPPFTFSATTAGMSVTGRSNAVAAPAGVTLSKLFSPTQLFQGMESRVTAAAANSGPAVYNITLRSTEDSFDILSAPATLTKTLPSLSEGGNLSVIYGVNMSSSSGSRTSSPLTAGFVFGGNVFSITGGTTVVSIYKPLSVSISTTPNTPEEGKSFTISVVIRNPSAVAVSDVQFALPLPSGLSLSNLQNAQVSSNELTVSAAALGPGSNLTATVTAVAGSGITVPFDSATLTFSYAGNTVSGATPSTSGIAIAENVTTRYLIPIAFVFLVMLAMAFYLRRRAVSAPSSPQ